MSEGTPVPQINASKIPGGGGVAGALFAVISMVIFLIGIPALRYFLLGAILLGCAVALVIHFSRHQTPGKPWLLAETEEEDRKATRDQLPKRSEHLFGHDRTIPSPFAS
jgi:hypothetical protein